MHGGAAEASGRKPGQSPRRLTAAAPRLRYGAPRNPGPGAARTRSLSRRRAPLQDDPRQREAREALDRVARDSELVGSSSIARAGRRLGDHFAGRDAIGTAEDGSTDPIELWGRRIGRTLSVVGFVVLALWLAAQLGMT